MSVKVRVYGDVLDLADDLEADFVATAKDSVGTAADLFLENVRKKLSIRRGPKPSPAGEPPALQEGKLLRSFRRLPVRVKGRVVSSGIESKDPGAARLEWGKVDEKGIRTLPHPYLGPAEEESEDGITRILNEAIP